MADNTALAVTIRQQQAVELIVAGHSAADAAVILGISVRTLRRYLASDEVLVELRAAHRERLAGLLNTALNAAPDAMRTLRAVAADATASEHARVGASRAILEHTHRFNDDVDVDVRLSEIEQRLEERERRDRGREAR